MGLKHYSKKVSLFKTISWRILASLDTALIVYLLTGSFSVSLSVSFLEVFTKTFLFYTHERAWLKLQQILQQKNQTKVGFLNQESNKNSFIKALSWRFFGTMDTIFISYFVTSQVNIAVMIGGFEIITKVFLYFFHERFWIWLVILLRIVRYKKKLNLRKSNTNKINIKQIFNPIKFLKI